MRYPSIDILRTIAIFTMVMVHFVENLSGITLPITGLGAPLFALLAGTSYRLWSSAQLAKGKSETEVTKISVRRGLFVFGAGFAFNILVWLPEDTFNWDVLTFIGVSLLLLNLLRRLPSEFAVVLALAAILIAPVLRRMADYPSYWTNRYFDYDYTLSDIFIGFFTTGYFPFFPWVAYPLLGFTLAKALFDESADREDIDRTLRRITIGGIILIVGAIATAVMHYYVPENIAKTYLRGWTMFPPSLAYVLGTFGIAMTALATLHHYVDRRAPERESGFLDVAKTFSRYSLTIYVLHHLVHIWPLWIYGELQGGDDPTIYWQKAMPIEASLPLAWLFLAICYVVFRKIGSQERYGLESCMRWLCD